MNQVTKTYPIINKLIKDPFTNKSEFLVLFPEPLIYTLGHTVAMKTFYLSSSLSSSSSSKISATVLKINTKAVYRCVCGTIALYVISIKNEVNHTYRWSQLQSPTNHLKVQKCAQKVLQM